MSDIENDPSLEGGADDPIKQLKGETYRKFDRLSSQLEEMKQSQAILLQQIAAVASPPAKPAAGAAPMDGKEDLSALMYDNPQRYHQIIAEQAAAAATQTVRQELQVQNRLTSTLTELASEYPELTDANHALTKKAASIFASLPEHERSSTVAYRFAVKQAAEELAVKPAAKREQLDNVLAGSGGNPYGMPRGRKKTDTLDPATEAWANVLGLDLEDPETKARLIKRAQRTDWGNPREPISNKKKGGRK